MCVSQTARLARLSRGRITTVSFREPGVLGRFPGVTAEACEREMKLVDRDGRVFGGAAAVAKALAVSHPVIGSPALLYFLPGIRSLADRVYAWVARNRFRISRRTAPCADGACGLHDRDRDRSEPKTR